MAVNLTTKRKVKTFIGIKQDDQSQDGLLDLIIAGVSRQVAAVCDRVFEQTTYKQWVDGTGSRSLRLPNAPVDRLYGVATHTITVGTIEYSGSAVLASVDLQPPRLTLVSAATDGTDSTDDITLTGLTMDELAVLVAAVSDWALTVSANRGSYPATQLQPISAGDAKSTSDIDFEHPDEYEEARIMAESDGMIELVRSCFPRGRSNVFVWYRAGYELPSETGGLLDNGTVPQGLELVVNQIVADVLDGADTDGALKSEKLGDYSYTQDGSATSTAVKRYEKELWPWKRKRI
jgi:hypothetical protein